MPAAVSQGEVEGHAVRVLRAPGGELEAAFAPRVGMVGVSLRHRGEELLGRRRGLDAYARTGSTMGIPLLAPWANRLSAMRYRAAGREVELAAGQPGLRLDPNGLPIHGLLAASAHWEVTGEDAGAERARLAARLDFGARPELRSAFPFPHVLTQEVELDDRGLSIATAVHATGGCDVPVSFGYHPYLRLPGVDREGWEIALPVGRRAQLDERGIPTGEWTPVDRYAGPLGAREFDDLYDDLATPADFVLSGGGRTISVSFEAGYPFAQVYAPAGQELICFEPMTAPTDALVSGDRLPLVAAGASYGAAFSIAVA